MVVAEDEFSNCRYKDTCKRYITGAGCPINDPSAAPFCMKLFRIGRLQDEAGLSDKQREPVVLYASKDSHDGAAFNRLRNIEQNIESFVKDGKSLYICSPNTGNGKTSWALRLLQSYFDKIWYKTDLDCKAMFISVPKLLIKARDNIDHKSEEFLELRNKTPEVNLVVWDDIGSKCLTAFERDVLFELIGGRTDNGKANIYTSNISDDLLGKCLGPQLYSRIFNTSEVIRLDGADKRGLSK